MENKDFVLGCDISLWQNDKTTARGIDFEKMKSAGVRFVFVKASQGVYADPDFRESWDGAARAGLPRGAYHFLDWRYDVLEQADFFASLLIKNDGELLPVLDYEMRHYAPKRGRAIQAARLFVERVGKILSRQVMLYTSPGFWQEFGDQDPYWAGLPLWIAHYSVEKPKVPAPWSDWTFWQYTDRGDGRRFGVESRQIDLDYFNGNWERFLTFGDIPKRQSQTESQAGSHKMYKALYRLRIRKEPNTQSPTVGYLEVGETVEALEALSDIMWIRHERGWSLAKYGREYMEAQ